MSWLSYHLRSAAFYWKSHLWVVLAVAVATAVLTGALVVGDSMRHSLRELAVGRLGRVDYALVAPRLFGADLASRMESVLSRELTATTGSDSPSPSQGEGRGEGKDSPTRRSSNSMSSLIMLRGAATHAASRTHVGRVNILGVNETFWDLDTAEHPPSITKLEDRSIVLNEPLANELGAKIGDDVILHLGKPNVISTETLLGRRDETTATLRLTVAAILPPQGLAAFELNPRQAFPQNAFVPLPTLQRALDQPAKANVLLLESLGERKDAGGGSESERLQRALAASVSIADVGLQLRFVNQLPVIESDALLIEPELESTVTQMAKGGVTMSPFLAYLANTISKNSLPDAPSNTIIPYSTVVAVDPESPWMTELRGQTKDTSLTLSNGGIILNQWTAEDLNAESGDAITLTYYSTSDSGTLETRSTTFTLQGVVPMEGIAADPDLVPQYKGVTDAKSLADWDPPFPIDLKLIRDKDEAYWKQFRTTPKAFISLADGQRLWTESGERFGRLTSIRLHPNPWTEPDWPHLSKELVKRLNLPALGLQFQPVRAQMIASSSGPTDFGTLFLSFSFFLIASAAMLVALLFRLGVEKRAFEIGLFLASGFTPRTITGLLLIEGLFVSTIGTLLGLLGAAGFAWLMLAGLSSWWSAAVNAPLLSLHLRPTTLALGAAISLLIAIATIAWSVRGLTRRSPRTLLAGWAGDETLVANGKPRRGTWIAIAIVALTMLGAMTVGANADAMTRSLSFFGSGAAALTLCLMALALWLRRHHGSPIAVPGFVAMLRLGMRSARRNRRRSLLTSGLLASAAFLIVSLEAFRLDPRPAEDRNSGSGGFSLYAESAAPLPYDLGTPAGRENLGITQADNPSLSAMSVSSFRLRPGDESSCMNLYRPARPRILGANDSFISRGGFDFAQTLAESEIEEDNPWSLLNRTFPDGSLPAIADANAVRWQYHLGLGKDLVIKDERGKDVPLRFVALLNNSALQDEIIIADASFIRLFPSTSGRSFFLIEAPGNSSTAVERELEAQLEQFGFDVATTQSRLRNYFAVQNTYISTFQTLGGLGLLLGAAGLAAVLARNVWERRRELALMRTAGFTRASLGLFVIAENFALVLAGMTAGVLSAVLAVSPMIADNASLPLRRLTIILSSVLVVGLLAGLGTVARALRAPLIPALRSE